MVWKAKSIFTHKTELGQNKALEMGSCNSCKDIFLHCDVI